MRCIPGPADGAATIRNQDAIHPFAQKLINEIVWRICRNEIRSGEQLPSIEEMAKQYDVGRSTIREAIRYVESTGLVHSIHGKGTFVLKFRQSAGGVDFIEDMVDVRKMIELHATRRAVISRSDEDLGRLKSLLEEMKRTSLDYQRFIDADRAFHGAIIGASGNSFLPSVFRNISGIYNAMQNALIYLDPSVGERSIVHHAKILSAIEKRESEAAVAYTEEHLDMIAEFFRKRGS